MSENNRKPTKFDVYVWTPTPQPVPFSQSMAGSTYVLFHSLDARDLAQLVDNVRGALLGAEHCVYIRECREEPYNLYDVLKRKSLWRGEVPERVSEDPVLNELLKSEPVPEEEPMKYWVQIRILDSLVDNEWPDTPTWTILQFDDVDNLPALVAHALSIDKGRGEGDGKGRARARTRTGPSV